MTLAFIPRGFLDKLRMISYHFLWFGCMEKRGIPLVKWKRLATPKEKGGWGLKNICHFATGLLAKNVCWLISNKCLW
jgi:hypothetical protein